MLGAFSAGYAAAIETAAQAGQLEIFRERFPLLEIGTEWVLTNQAAVERAIDDLLQSSKGALSTANAAAAVLGSARLQRDEFLRELGTFWIDTTLPRPAADRADGGPSI